MTAETADWTKFWGLVKDIRFAMLTAHHPNGHLHSRPMTTMNGKDDRAGVLWFFTSRSSEPVLDIGASPEVNVAYADPGRDAYVSVAGHARLVDDPTKRKALWGPMVQAWFPGGPADPDVALIAVTIEHADYWDVKTNKAMQLVKMATAALTGTRPSMGEHGRVRAS